MSNLNVCKWNGADHPCMEYHRSWNFAHRTCISCNTRSIKCNSNTGNFQPLFVCTPWSTFLWLLHILWYSYVRCKMRNNHRQVTVWLNTIVQRVWTQGSTTFKMWTANSHCPEWLKSIRWTHQMWEILDIRNMLATWLSKYYLPCIICHSQPTHSS